MPRSKSKPHMIMIRVDDDLYARIIAKRRLFAVNISAHLRDALRRLVDDASVPPIGASRARR